MLRLGGGLPIACRRGSDSYERQSLIISSTIPRRLILWILQPKSGRYDQIEVSFKTMGFWQRVLEGEKYVTGSLVPLTSYTIRQSFLQVIASQATQQVVKELTRILLNEFDWRYHPTTNGQLKYERDALVGHGNRYISIDLFLRLLFLILAHTLF